MKERDMKKLNERQIIVLLMINERCDGERYYVAPYSGDTVYVNVGKYVNGTLNTELQTVFIHGSITATFRYLEKQGLIRRPKTPLPNKFVYEMTEKGTLAVEKYRCAEKELWGKSETIKSRSVY
jgi:hypothetical protein